MQKISSSKFDFGPVLAGAKRGEEKAILALWEEVKPIVYKIANRSEIRAKLGEDAVSIGKNVLMESITDFKSKEPREYPTYFKTAVIHAVYNELHYYNGYAAVEAKQVDISIQDRETYQEDFEGDTMWRYVRSLLKPKEYELIRLMALEGLCVKSAAIQIGVSERHARNLRDNAKEKLKFFLQNSSAFFEKSSLL